ncbi:MAG: T9SS type A sorting domain-containing protein [Candidatus Delongbacteria bacterium]|nr:T9SS type A sorting domain-containing protein [bacterium]MBL7034046.1 T9SS type A sorting domain-containing protein [Candidatus Delongbacteria bacterium]
MTIRNNWAPNYGGGIYCEESSPDLECVVIADNIAVNGGGVYLWLASNPSFINVTVTGNYANYGGGICSWNNSNPHFVNVEITNNTAEYRGGGIHCYYNSFLSLEHVTMSYNTAYSEGGGLFCWSNSNLSVENSILWHNTPQELFFLDISEPNSITISCSDIEGGEAGIEANDNGYVYWLENNLDTDPLFCDPENGDYRLQLDSPCRTDICGFMGYTGETCEGEGVEDLIAEPSGFYLADAYPNPFNPSTTIEYSLATSGSVQLSVYNIRGQLIYEIQDGFMPAGQHSVTWSPTHLSSGIFFVELCAGGEREVIKVSYIK